MHSPGSDKYSSNININNEFMEQISPTNNTIDEEPELNTEAELSDAELGKKFFRKIGTGSTINSTISFFAFSPIIMLFLSSNIFKAMGIIPGIISIGIFILASYLSLCMLLRLIVEKKFRTIFQTLIGFVDKKIKYFFIAFYLQFYFGYLVINVKLCDDIASSFFSEQPLLKLVIIVPCMVLQICLSLLKDIKYTRVIKFIHIFIVIIGTLVYSIVDYSINTKKNFETNYLAKIPSWSYFFSFSIINILLFNHLNLFQESRNLKGFSKKRGLSLLIYTLSSQLIIFLLLGLAGFFLFYNSQEDTFFFLRTQGQNSILDILFKSLFLLVFLTEASISIIQIIEGITFSFQKNQIDKKLYIVISFFSAFFSNLFGYFIINQKIYLKIIISFIGGICSTVIEYIVPSLVYLTIMEKKMINKNKILIYILMIGMSVIGIASTVGGIYYSTLNK